MSADAQNGVFFLVQDGQVMTADERRIQTEYYAATFPSKGFIQKPDKT